MNLAPNSRTWTDDDLRRAVAAQTSWKGVARALGLAPSGYQRLRRRARALDLDESHFKGKRRWSDYDLRRAVAASGSWRELLERLDVSDTSETRLYLKGHAARLGIDMSQLNARPKTPSLDSDVLAGQPVMSKLRVAAETLAIAWFIVRGCRVAVPTEPCEYDLLVTFPGRGVKRVQVKSSTFRRDHGTWRVGVGRRPYVLDKSAGAAPYEPDVVDFFFIVVGDGSIYIVPSEVLTGMTSINIGAYAKCWVGDASSLLAGALS